MSPSNSQRNQYIHIPVTNSNYGSSSVADDHYKQPDYNESEKFQFRGIFTPPAIVEMLSRGEISPVEYFLLSLIESLTKCRKEGCWARNSFFAKAICKQKRVVQYHFQSLQERGLLRTYIKDRDGVPTRYLEAVWTDMKPENSGKVNPENNKKQKTDPCKKLHPPMQEIAPPPHARNCTHIEDRIEDRQCRSQPGVAGHAATVCGSSESKDEKHQTSSGGSGKSDKSSLFGKDEVVSQEKSWASQLYQNILKHDKEMRRPNLKTWQAEFTKLKKELPSSGPELITKVLNWYCLHMDEEFVPVAYSAKTFRLKFDSIRQAMKRSGPESTPASTNVDMYEQIEFTTPDGQRRMKMKLREEFRHLANGNGQGKM